MFNPSKTQTVVFLAACLLLGFLAVGQPAQVVAQKQPALEGKAPKAFLDYRTFS